MKQKFFPKKVIDQKLERIVRHPIGGPTFWNVANSLTFFRIFISPIFSVIYLQYEALGITVSALPYILLSLLTISELSDALDGYLARKYNQVTDLGKILDPMADSISRISVFLTFTQPPVNISLLYVFIFLYRDSIISTLRTICALRGFALAARPTGKIKAILQAICCLFITALLIPYSLGRLSAATLNQCSSFAIVLCCLYAIYSAFDYFLANWLYIQRVLIRTSERRRVRPSLSPLVSNKTM